MDFSLTEEQSLLKESIDRYVHDNFTVDRHRRLSQTPLCFERDSWQQFSELGWLGLLFSEDDDGFGGDAVDAMVMMEALGRQPAREPYLTTVVTCGGFISHAGNAEQRKQYIPNIINGEQQWAFAFAEPNSGYAFSQLDTCLKKAPGGYRLTGNKIGVLNGHAANYLIVTAINTDAAIEGDDSSRLSLVIVDTAQPGVELHAFNSIDGSGGATVIFNDVRIDDHCLLGPIGEASTVMDSVIQDSIVAMGAEALGIMQSLLDTTVEYTKTREQFGQPIGRFQSLQHRTADMYLMVEETRSLVLDAAIQLSDGLASSRKACAALKVKLAEAGRFVSQQAVQLHGGIGMTDELSVGHHFKRLLLLSQLYGDEDYYLDRYCEQMADESRLLVV